MSTSITTKQTRDNMKKLINLTILVAIVVFFSCKKEDTPETYDTTSSQDNNKMESAFDGVYDVVKTHVEEEVDNASAKYGQVLKTAGDNATVTVRNDSIIVDFGDGTVGSDGRVRKGVVYIEYDGGYRETGTTLTTTLENYYVDGVKVEGTKVVKNTGTNTSGDIVFTVEVTDGKLTYPNGSTISEWNSTRTRLWTGGYDTPLNVTDDVYEIYGEASGINRNGLAYDIEIPSTDPLLIDINCWLESRMPKDGVIYVYPDGLDTRSVDYGTGGECDRKVTVSIGDFSINLSL